MRDPNERGWKQGWWQCTVCWLEQQAVDEGVTIHVKTFYEEGEMSQYMSERAESGNFVAVSWSMETFLGGRGHPRVPTYSDEEWEEMVNGVVITDHVVSNEPGERRYTE